MPARKATEPCWMGADASGCRAIRWNLWGRTTPQVHLHHLTWPADRSWGHEFWASGLGVGCGACQPARGLDRPSCEIAPPLESDRGSNRADPKMERSSRVVTLLTLGDPRIDPRIAAHCRCLASRTIPAPCRTWINVFWATILLIHSSPDSSTCTRGSTRLST